MGRRHPETSDIQRLLLCAHCEDFSNMWPERDRMDQHSQDFTGVPGESE